MSTATIRLLQPRTVREWSAVRELIEEYVASLNVDLAFQDIAHELDSLAIEYGPPAGAFLLAEEGGSRLGCVGVREFAPDTGEVKRLYVRAIARGRGLGRLLAEGAVAQARTLGYRRLVLDTLPTMAAAHSLYGALGFRPIEPYRFNPVPGTAFLELTLG